MQCHGEARPRNPSILSQALYHWGTALPMFLMSSADFFKINFLKKIFQEH